MSDQPNDLTLERVSRLSQSVTDLMENHAVQSNTILLMLNHVDEQLATLAKEVRELVSEQALLGNRIENAFAHALRANVRLKEVRDLVSEQALLGNRIENAFARALSANTFDSMNPKIKTGPNEHEAGG